MGIITYSLLLQQNFKSTFHASCSERIAKWKWHFNYSVDLQSKTEFMSVACFDLSSNQNAKLLRIARKIIKSFHHQSTCRHPHNRPDIMASWSWKCHGWIPCGAILCKRLMVWSPSLLTSPHIRFIVVHFGSKWAQFTVRWVVSLLKTVTKSPK